MKQNETIENSNKKITKKGIVKFDPDTAKTLPITTGRKRTSGYFVSKKYNNLTIEIKAFESLNGYDLITFFQMLDDYQKNPDKWEYNTSFQLKDENERIVKKRIFKLKNLCKQRQILNKKPNRISIAKSFKRWYQAELIYNYHKENNILETRYIYEYMVSNDNYDELIIIANCSFLDFCLENGMAMNWERLVKYGKNYYGLELDIYLQFRSIQYGKKTKKYKYPDVIKEQTLFHHIGLNNDVKDIKHKREKLKLAFKKFEEITGIKYILQKDEFNEYKWVKSYSQFIEK